MQLSALLTPTCMACRYPASREMLQRVDAFCVHASISLAAHSRAWPAYSSINALFRRGSALSQVQCQAPSRRRCNAYLLLSPICMPS